MAGPLSAILIPWRWSSPSTRLPDFSGGEKVHTAHLVEAGGELPVVLIFVDTDDHVNRVLPRLREMAAHRLIVRENVVLEQGSLD